MLKFWVLIVFCFCGVCWPSLSQADLVRELRNQLTANQVPDLMELSKLITEALKPSSGESAEKSLSLAVQSVCLQAEILSASKRPLTDAFINLKLLNSNRRKEVPKNIIEFSQREISEIETYLSLRSDPQVSEVYWLVLSKISFLMDQPDIRIKIMTKLIASRKNQGLMAEAISAGEAWLNTPRIDSGERIRALVAMGDIAVAMNSPTEAKSIHEKLKFLLPSHDLQAIVLQGNLFALQGKYQKCETRFKKGVSPQSRNSSEFLLMKAQLTLILCLSIQGKYEQANEATTKLGDSSNSWSRIATLRILLEQKKTEEAFNLCSGIESLIGSEDQFSVLQIYTMCRVLAKSAPIPGGLEKRFRAVEKRIRLSSLNNKWTQVPLSFIDAAQRKDNKMMAKIKLDLVKQFGVLSLLGQAAAKP